jgi:hypothetical protein
MEVAPERREKCQECGYIRWGGLVRAAGASVGPCSQRDPERLGSRRFGACKLVAADQHYRTCGLARPAAFTKSPLGR